ncbi:phosphotransferase [Paraglaciecola sp. 20A4]|uniref:phosphotransferase n=1 Tax=Paraglaciecola sp. 20A4 TaxID=2687288 RepID=UPI00140C2AC7
MSPLAQRQAQLMDWINHSTPFLCQQLHMVYGDASFRRYFRFTFEGHTIIAVDAPPKFEDSHKFALVAELLAANGLKVPDILAADHDLGFYCLNDFGDVQLAHRLNEKSCHRLYPQALALLPKVQQCVATSQAPLPIYDHKLFSAEFEIFTQWLLNVHLALTITTTQQALLSDTFNVLADNFFEQPKVGVHRDFHSRNLMMLVNDEIGVIDFQDAVVGPITYDAVSLLRDCYRRWPDEWVSDWLQAFHGQFYAHYPLAQFTRWFDLTGMQRHIKASGIFARLHHRDGKSDYLGDIPRTLGYLVDIGRLYPQLSAFSDFIEQDVLPHVLASQNSEKTKIVSLAGGKG